MATIHGVQVSCRVTVLEVGGWQRDMEMGRPIYFSATRCARRVAYYDLGLPKAALQGAVYFCHMHRNHQLVRVALLRVVSLRCTISCSFGGFQGLAMALSIPILVFSLPL